MDVPVDRYIYFATEDAEVDVPIVNKKRMCRNGCCTTCAVKVLEGKVRLHVCVRGQQCSQKSASIEHFGDTFFIMVFSCFRGCADKVECILNEAVNAGANGLGLLLWWVAGNRFMA